MKCTGGNICGQQCPNKAERVNQSGVVVCEHHKQLLDAFTWENRNERVWKPIASKGIIGVK